MKADVVSAVTNIPLFLDYDGYIGSMQYWSENHQVRAGYYIMKREWGKGG